MTDVVDRTPNETFAGYTQFVVEVCCSCGVMFAMPEALQRRALKDHGRIFYCPNGHGQHYTGRTEEEKLRAALEAERREAGRLAAQRDQLKASLSAQRGVTTKLKKRVAAGVCPCCNRTFQNLSRHMAGQHPDFAESHDA